MQTASGPHPRKAFRDKYLAAFGVVALLLCSLIGSAQIFQYPNPGTYGTGEHRRVVDSTLYFPTGCGAPSGISSLNSFGFTGFGQKIRQAAIYADTCGHNVYWFDWTDSAWVQFGAGGSGTDSALAALYGLKIFISGTTRYIVADTNAMATRLNRDKLKDSVFGVLNAAINLKKDKSDSAASTGYLPVHRLADTAAVLRSILSSGYDSASSQGGGFHTQPYNDIRYKIASDSAGVAGYASFGRLYKLRDSILAVLNASIALKKDKFDSLSNTSSYVTLGRLYKTLDSLNALVAITNYRSVGGGGHQLWNFSASGNQSTLTFRQLRDSGDITIVDAGDSGAVLYVAPKMNNYGSAPGFVEFNYASIPAATGYPTGTQLIVPDSGQHYVDTGSGGTRGWKRIIGGGVGGSSALSGLSDVNISSPSNLQLLQFQTGDSKWHNFTHSFAFTNANNTFGNTQTFSNAPIFTGLSGYLKGNNTSAITASATIPIADLATIAAHSYVGNNTGSTAAPAAISNTQVTADLNPFTTSLQGLVPSPGGTASGRTLFDNGTWGNIPYPSILFRYNVVDFGADTTGNTANAVVNRRAVDSCLAAAMRSPLPAAVVFPSGNYALDSPLINITKSIAIEGYNAYLKCSNTNAFTMLSIKADSVRLRGLKFIGNGNNQKGVDINGFKYFSVRDGEFSNLNVGSRFANTSATFSAGDVDGVNYFNNTIGLFSDTLGEYVTVRGGLFKSNTVAIQDDGGNNTYVGGNSNSNTTAFKFTGGSNNSHGVISAWNANHNGTSIDANGAIYGETIDGSHFYEGVMSFVSCSNWRFTGQTILGPSTLTISQCANMDFSDAFIDPTYGTTRNFSGNFNKPTFASNMGATATNVTVPNGSITVGQDSMGVYPYRSSLTIDTLDLGIARWWYKSLSADDTIKRIIHPTAGRTYRLEVVANGHNMVFLDNTKIDGTFNSSAALNVYYIECIDDGADPRFIVRVSQPGILVSRPTSAIGWGRLTGAGSISGSSITKSGPDALSFTVQAVPDKVLGSGDGYYSFQAISTYGNIVAGLSKTAVQNDWHSIDYGIYFFGSSGGAANINIAENGTLISSGIGSAFWTTNDSFRVKVTGTTVTYEKYSGGTWNVFYTSTHAVTTYPLIPQVSIRALTTFTNPRLYGAGVINNLQSYFAVQYADNVNAKQKSFLGAHLNPYTVSAGTNVAAVNAGDMRYTLVDSIVTINVRGSWDVTTANSLSTINVTLPVTCSSYLSSLEGSYMGSGTWYSAGTADLVPIGALMTSSTTVQLFCKPPVTSSTSFSATFMYHQ